MTVKIEHFPMTGGLNLSDSALALTPGEALLALNYEHRNPKGYRRIDGYERYDGRSLASDASYNILNFDSGGTTPISAGNTVTGGTSGATAYVLVEPVLTAGSWSGGDGAGYMVLGDVTGTFQDNEAILVSAVDRGTVNGVATSNSAGTDTLHNTYIRAAIERRRSLIGAVTGINSVLGVWMFNGNTYAFRTQSGGASAKMFKATASGWTEQDLGRTLNFTTGTAAPSLGDTITGATSGATGVLRKMIVTSGTWGGGNASGRMILSGCAGTFQAGENLQVAAVTKCVQSGDQEVHVLPAGGRYEFLNQNFYGASDYKRMYAVNGVGRAFEFDGNCIVPIITGMTTDTPNHIAEIKNHLVLSFPGGSVQLSPIGDPTATWTAVLGASEIGAGDDVTAIQNAPGDALVIYCRNKIRILYGSSSLDWNLVNWSYESGAVEWSVQRMSRIIHADDRGLGDLAASQKWGDFTAATFSYKVQDWFLDRIGSVTASLRVRSKDQYRLFYSDGYGLYASFNGDKLLGFTQVKFYDAVQCCSSCEDASGNEILLFGDSNGYVYRLDSGTSFDGGEIPAYLRIPFWHFKSPRTKKRFRKIILEMEALSQITLYYQPDFDYSSLLIPQARTEEQDISQAGGYWNVHDWNEFAWSAQAISQAEASIDGIGLTMGINLYSSGAYDQPHTVQSALIHYSPRGLQR